MNDPNAEFDPSDPPGLLAERAEELWHQLDLMVRHLEGKGTPVPAPVLDVLAMGPQVIPATGIMDLVKAHARMATLVAPATPLSLAATQVDGRPAGLWDIRLLRNMMIFCGLAVVAFVLSSLTAVNGTGTWEVLGAQIAYLSAAAVGASFFGLYRAHGFVSNRTFDPSYGAQYWVRFALGILAGMILANIIDPNVLLMNDGASGAAQAQQLLTRNVIALLGGYSADAVNRILTRLVETMETLVAGRMTSVIEEQKRVIEERVRNELQQQRLARAAELISLHEELRASQVPPTLEARFKAILDDLINEVGG